MTYYIVNCFGKASSADGYEWLEVYKITGNTIKTVSVIVVTEDYIVRVDSLDSREFRYASGTKPKTMAALLTSY